MTSERQHWCPVCNSQVRVVSSGEGTMHYQPVIPTKAELAACSPSPGEQAIMDEAAEVEQLRVDLEAAQEALKETMTELRQVCEILGGLEFTESAIDLATKAVATLAANTESIGKCGLCGGPMSKNPHREAGRPHALLEVGPEQVCIPCLVWSRHGWAVQAMTAEATLTAVVERAEQLAGECTNWQETARRAHCNTDYYRELVVSIGKGFGQIALTADDSTIMEDVLCAKVPELVASLQAENEQLRADVDRLQHYILDNLEETLPCSCGAEQEINNLPMPPGLDGETPGQYTDRLTGADGTKRVPYQEHHNRQCSIGYHEECSDPDGERCKCPCHQIKHKPGCLALRKGSADANL